MEVKCQNERSQHQNRAMARKMLLARLARLEEEKREAQEAVKYKNRAKVGFGSQIRNYFLHPTNASKTPAPDTRSTTFKTCWTATSKGFSTRISSGVKGEMAGASGTRNRVRC